MIEICGDITNGKASIQIPIVLMVEQEDHVTKKFKSWADVWRPVTMISDEDLSARIRADGIDILVDLSGHSKGNRLLTFARKPAPIQVTIGTGNGMPEIDYLLSDPVTTPAEARSLFAETIYDLPCAVAFDAPDYAPDVAQLPALARGQVTFGCLNRLSKVSPAALDLWARIVLAVPRSRLLLKDTSLDNPDIRARTKEMLGSFGLDDTQIELRGATSHREHLAVYNEIDIALDPFPANGGITTWEALWMGAPVVTKLGAATVSSRISGAIFTAIGLKEWIAEDDEGYFALAVKSASDLDALAKCRRELRERILSSAAGNPELATRALEAAYRDMWRKWCQNMAMR